MKLILAKRELVSQNLYQKIVEKMFDMCSIVPNYRTA